MPVTDAPVLVTGASGFVATHIVEQLLAGGYRVRGTVRNPEKSRQQGYLTSLGGAGERLELVAADLLTEGAFDEAVRGCEYVMHTASPYVLTVKDAQRDLVDPAVKGTLSVLEACMSAESVKRMVVTSSVAAMTDHYTGEVIDENTWNTRSTLDHNPYYFSKAEAERAAWAFMEERSPHFDLVVINPFGILGPEHSDSVNTTNRLVADMTTAKSPFIIDSPIGLVDVRDVARSHIAAMETPDASGRYVCCAAPSNFRDVASFMKREFPGVKSPSISLDGSFGTKVMKVMAMTQPAGVRTLMRDNLGGSLAVDNSKIKRELGVEFRPLEDTSRDTIQDMIDRGKIKA